jgi:hypothetical protein
MSFRGQAGGKPGIQHRLEEKGTGKELGKMEEGRLRMAGVGERGSGRGNNLCKSSDALKVH